VYDLTTDAKHPTNYWVPWLMHVSVEDHVADAEIIRWKRLILRQPPSSMPAPVTGWSNLAFLPHQKVFFGSDTTLYRSTAGVLRTDSAFSATRLQGITDTGIVTNLNADTLDGKHAKAFALVGLRRVAYSITVVFDASTTSTFTIMLAGNVTSSTLSNATAGQQLNFIICQDKTGHRDFYWPANVHGGMAVGQSSNKCSAQSFVFDGTNAYATTSGAVDE
jgi:hypothetical protein